MADNVHDRPERDLDRPGADFADLESAKAMDARDGGCGYPDDDGEGERVWTTAAALFGCWSA